MMLPERCVIRFTANWCAPCKSVGPLVASVASDFGVPLISLDIEAFPQIAERYHVTQLPTVVGLRGGQPVGAIVGAQNRASYQGLLEKVAEEG